MSPDLSLSRTSTVSSTTPLTQQQQPQKGWSATFDNLQSSYGIGDLGLPKPAKKARQVKSLTEGVLTMASPHQHPLAGQKNYELAFGKLAGSYGYGGTVFYPAIVCPENCKG